MSYRPPTADIQWALSQVARLDDVLGTGGFSSLDADQISGLLDEAGRFSSEVIAPLSRIGDQVGSTRDEDGSVTSPPGYREAYRRFVDAGWPAAAFPEEWGGGGLPTVLGLAIQEMITSADMAFSLCPMLTYSASEMLLAHGSDAVKGTYLEHLVSGDWTGTMVLTEPHAGSDLGDMHAIAEPADDGTWRLRGTKIFITWGEHDLTDNIVHTVLARTPGSAPGTAGLSCFAVPKFLVQPDGSLGDRNDIHCVSIEHKVGIHASPTCVLSFGDSGEGAVAELIGDEGAGMRYMFTMMNLARLLVGVEGLAVSERAYQQAAAYAATRTQGKAVGDEMGPSPIIRHPDVRRMLMTMRSHIEAMRCLMYRNAAAIDLGTAHPDPDERRREADLAALLTPLSKAWGTDAGVEMTSLGIQIHGGSGYVEETGAAQWWRDARIAPIYEGTNGLQAIDLIGRKLPLDGGATVRGLLTELRAGVGAAADSLGDATAHLLAALDATERATEYLLSAERRDALSGATTYLRMLAITAAGCLLAIGAATADDAQAAPEFIADKLATARFFSEHSVGSVPGLLGGVLGGAETVFAVPEERFPGPE